MNLPEPRARALQTLGAIPMLLAYLGAGIASAVTGAPTLVHEILGPTLGGVWVWLMIAAPILSLLSIFTPDSYSSAWLSCAGGLIAVAALGAYWIGTVERFGWSTVTAWFAMGLTCSTLLLAGHELKTLRRIAVAARKSGM